MCRISPISDDWVTKGFPIHVNEIELVMRPDHQGGIIFKRWFARDAERDAHPAIKIATGLLADEAWRDRFRDVLIKAQGFVVNERGAMQSLANGRALEFKFLIIALNRMESSP